jgi:hypothetical protein
MSVGRIGSRNSTGPMVSRPTSSLSRPHRKTATVAPRETPTESRKPSAALRGTQIERNTATSRMTASPTTTAR